VSDTLAQGAAALERGDWDAARDAYGAVLAEAAAPEALDGLGLALWWSNRLDEALELRARAYAAYLEAERPAPAVRIAAWLAREFFTVHGNMPAASGWLSRAETVLSQAGPCAEAGWLALMQAALSTDTSVMKQLAEHAIGLGRSFGEKDLELVGLSAKGLAYVCAADVAQGMTFLDEAMAAAMGGEIRDFGAFSDVYCNTLLACERAGDFEHAEQWCRVVMEQAQRRNARPLFPFCHVTYGAVLAVTGRWAEAEEELELAARLFGVGHRAMRVLALSRLADLRIRQGRVEEAGVLLAGFEEHPMAIRSVARLLLAQGKASAAAGMVRRRLDVIGTATTLATPLLAVLVDVQLAIGNLTGAGETARTLSDLARHSEQRSALADAAYALGTVALAAGEASAVRHLDDAIAQYDGLQQPLESGRARLHCARAHAAADPEIAVSLAESALALFDRLGARRDADAAAAFLRELGVAATQARPRTTGVLTRREQEVLDLVAAGLSNAEIAARLFLSPKTAENHVSNVLRKLQVRSRTEAAAYVLRQTQGSI
jgi:DNA-binding CsgD family transcriptional regulator